LFQLLRDYYCSLFRRLIVVSRYLLWYVAAPAKRESPIGAGAHHAVHNAATDVDAWVAYERDACNNQAQSDDE